MSKDEEIALLKAACDQYKQSLNDALFEIKVYKQKFLYVAEGGSFYLSIAAEGARIANSFLKKYGYGDEVIIDFEPYQSSPKHAKEPVIGYNACPGCEVEYLRAKLKEEKEKLTKAIKEFIKENK